MRVVALWSGGKDSALACFKAMENYEVVSLINFLDDNGKRSLSHGISKDIINIQMQTTDIPFVQNSMPWKEYKNRFMPLMKSFRIANGAEGIIFGDIYLKAHKEWTESVCSELGMKAITPLWGIDTKKLAKEFIDLEFKSIIVAVNSKFMGPEFLGRTFNYTLIDELQKMKIDPCGEEGEFHTFVHQGPIFKKAFKFSTTKKSFHKDKFSNSSWFLELKDASIEKN